MMRRFRPSIKTLITLILAIAILAILGASPALLQTDDDDFLLFLPAFIKQTRYLLITPAHLEVLKKKVRDNAPEWATLKDNVDTFMNANPVDYYDCSPENIALVYLLTRDPKYATQALRWARDSMSQDVRADSYLMFNDYMRRPALVLNYCGDALTRAERTELANYLDQWTYELWFNNQGSGWALDDPGNNYHMAFLEGTAFAGYALRQIGHPQAKTYLAVLLDKLNKSSGVMNYLNTRVLGGDWCEGVAYGEAAKHRLNDALSVIASMDGNNYFIKTPFFANSIYYAHYQLQPGNGYLYPGGDLPRISNLTVNPYDRRYLQPVIFWLPDGNARRYGQWYLENVISNYVDPDGSPFRWLYYLDMLYKLSLPSMAQDTLPKSYRAGGTNWCSFRSGWDAAATCVSLSGLPIIDQDHGHHDVGSFIIWKYDWLAVDANTYEHDGLAWEPGAHNMLHVDGAEWRSVPTVPGLTRYWDSDPLAYVQVEGTGLFRRYVEDAPDYLFLDEWTREFVYFKPDTVVVYDRVKPKSGSTYNLRFHFPVQPALASGLYTASNNGGGISLLPLASGTISVQQDTDVGDRTSTAWRVQQSPATPSAGRFLNVLQVVGGTPPALAAQRVTTTTNVMEGALWLNDVVMFSTNALGAPPALPFSYTLPGTGARTHTLLNMTGSCDVAATHTGGQTTVTVNPGATYSANSQGVLRFTQ